MDRVRAMASLYRRYCDFVW